MDRRGGFCGPEDVQEDGDEGRHGEKTQREAEKEKNWWTSEARRWREMESLAAAHPDFKQCQTIVQSFYFSWLTETRNALDKVIQGMEAAKAKLQQTVRKIIPISVERDSLLLRAAAVTHL